MNSSGRHFAFGELFIAAFGIVVFGIVPGCSHRGAANVSQADVDPNAAAVRAVEAFDKNGDASIDAEEAAGCPPLLLAKATFDVNADGLFSVDEIQNRLKALYGSGSALTNFDCTVTFGGRPIGGAIVKLRPVDFLSESLPSAQGETDDQGMVRPTVGAEHLPAELSSAPLMFPGLYHVEITHPQTTIPARYNTATELGWEVDPSSRTGTSARFDLKSN